MRQILIRGLRRSFVISGAPANGPLEALRSEPELPAPTHSPEHILIEPRAALWRMHLPNGTCVDDSLRGLAADLDARLVRNACALEPEALVLPGALLHMPADKRVLIVAPRSTLRTGVVIGLLRGGWLYECNSLAFARRDGVVAFPQMLRASPQALRFLPEQRAPDWGVAPQGISYDGEWRVVDTQTFDTQTFASPGRIHCRPPEVLVFLRVNGGSSRQFAPISGREAFSRALALALGAPTAASLAALMINLANARCYEVHSDDAEDAAARLSKLSTESASVSVRLESFCDTATRHAFPKCDQRS